MFGEELAVQSKDFRDVNDRVATKPAGSRRQQGVPRRLRKLQIRRNHGDENGLDTAAIKRVGLNDQHGPPVTGFRTSRLRQVRPPDLASLNIGQAGYQPFFFTDFNCARCKAGWTFAGRRE